MSEERRVPETWLTLRPPKGRFPEILDAYHRALIRDALLFKDGDDAGRQGAARALTHTIEFLNRAGLPNPVLEPLAAATLAILDLDRGIQSELLRPTRRPGRPPASSNEEVQDGVIAAIAEGFQRAAAENGWSHNVAMSRAARAMNAGGGFPRLTGTRVKNIRTKVSGADCGFAKDQFAALTQDPDFVAAPLRTAQRIAAAPFGAGNTNLQK